MEYKLIQTDIEEKRLFYRLEGEAAERHGVIGHMRFDFGKGGTEFWTTWFDNQKHLKAPAFKAEFDNVINYLREGMEHPLLGNRREMRIFYFGHSDWQIADHILGAKVLTEDYSYYLRFRPTPNDYDGYVYAYDNRYLLPELAGEHSLPNYCFAMLPSSGEMIRIQRDEQGYFLCNSKGMSPETVRVKVNNENQLRGVTRAQEEAMLTGSLFGWDSPAAKPWNYDSDGKPLPINQPKKNEPER
jgi:hypothetical protein